MIRRQRNLADYALRCLHRYRMRTMVVIIAVTITVAAFSSVAFMKDGLARDAQLSLQLAPDVTVQYMQSGRQSLIPLSSVAPLRGQDPIPINYVTSISGITGVDRVAPRVWGYVGVGKNTLILMGIDLKAVGSSYSNVLPMDQGTFLNITTRGSIVLGNVAALALNVRVGDTVTMLSETMRTVQFRVIGIFDSAANIYAADLVLMSIDDARDYFGVPKDKASDLCVYVKDPKLASKIATDISFLPSVRVLSKDLIGRSYQSIYGSRSGFFTVIWQITLLTMALIALNQFTVVGSESMFEVGVLKALGFSTSNILSIRLIESSIIGVFSASLGMTLGIIYDTVFDAPGLKEYMLGWAQIYPSFKIPVYIDLSSVFLIFAVTLIPLLFSTVVPSWKNAIVDPDIAMRGAKA
jgi:ABC-type lipoprotein release transport system permease subunit